jgi:predicted transposase YbfD/YdcC
MQLFTSSFAVVPDPRADNSRHDLIEILFIAFVSILCGCKTCVEIVEFAEAKKRFFAKILSLKHGIPSHDTFSSVFRILDPKALDEAFRKFMAAFGTALAERGIIAIDGKALKGAYEKGRKHAPKMMVSAFAAEMRMTLASLEAKGRNEVDAALEILGLVDLKGKIVTADALHTSRPMAQAIIDRGGDYCLALKGNQDSLLSDARSTLAKAGAITPTAESSEKGHERVEKRRAIVVKAPGLAAHHEFAGLTAFGRIEATRSIDGELKTEVRIYALSFAPKPAELLRIARTHWQIENGLHWELDVVMGEDRNRSRKDNAAQNIAVMRRLALNVARSDTTKGSLAGKLRRAGWNEEYLLLLLGQTR